MSGMEESSRPCGDNINSLWENSELFHVNCDNGYVLCDKFFIPEEVLALILSYVPPKELVFNCRRICKSWCHIIDSIVWRIKLRRINFPGNKVIQLPWFASYWIIIKGPFNRNLIRNNCGQANLKFWDILSCGGDGWKVEKPPVGCSEFPVHTEGVNVSNAILENNSCFVTSFYSCSKKQLINLKKEGICSEVMDILQPSITIRDWCCGRFDCGCVYELKAKLISENQEILVDYELRKNLGAGNGSDWQMVSHTFTNYGPGVKFIEFYHGGMDSQFWKGHYGSKMTGSSVTIFLQKPGYISILTGYQHVVLVTGPVTPKN